VFLRLGLFCIKSFDLWRVPGGCRGAGGDKVWQGLAFDKEAAWGEAHPTLVGRGRGFWDFGRLMVMMRASEFTSDGSGSSRLIVRYSVSNIRSRCSSGCSIFDLVCIIPRGSPNVK